MKVLFYLEFPLCNQYIQGLCINSVFNLQVTPSLSLHPTFHHSNNKFILEVCDSASVL